MVPDWNLLRAIKKTGLELFYIFLTANKSQQCVISSQYFLTSLPCRWHSHAGPLPPTEGVSVHGNEHVTQRNSVTH